jgi:hypothetical protein
LGKIDLTIGSIDFFVIFKTDINLDPATVKFAFEESARIARSLPCLDDNDHINCPSADVISGQQSTMKA